MTASRVAVPRLPTAYFGLSRGGEQRTISWRTLKNRSFRYYFIGSVTSDFGTWLQNTAQVLLAYRLSHSVLVVGLVTCAQFSSPLVLGPWAGVMTDKFGGRRILLATQLTAATVRRADGRRSRSRAICTRGGCGAGPSQADWPSRSRCQRETSPCDGSSRPKDIRPAFAMDSVSYNLGRAVAPPISVLLVTTAGFGWAFAANSLSFLVFAGCLVLAGHGQPTGTPGEVADQGRLQGRPSGLADRSPAAHGGGGHRGRRPGAGARARARRASARQPELVGVVHRRARRRDRRRARSCRPAHAHRSGSPPVRLPPWPCA